VPAHVSVLAISGVAAVVLVRVVVALGVTVAVGVTVVVALGVRVVVALGVTVAIILRPIDDSGQAIGVVVLKSSHKPVWVFFAPEITVRVILEVSAIAEPVAMS